MRWNLRLGLMLGVFIALGLVGCNEKKTEEINNERAEVVFPSAKLPIKTTYFTEDHIGAFICHPKRVLASKFAKTLFAAIEKKAAGSVERFFKSIVDASGVDLRQLDEFVLLVDKQSANDPATFLEGLSKYGFKKIKPKTDVEPTDRMPSFIIRFSEPLDSKAVLDRFRTPDEEEKDKNAPDPIQAKPYAGTTIYFHTDEGVAFCFVDGKTIIGGEEDLLKKMIDAKEVETPLTKQLAKIGMEHDIIHVLAESAEHDAIMTKLLVNLPIQMIPEELTGLTKYIPKVKAQYYTLSITTDPLCAAVATMSDESTAAKLAAEFNAKALPKLKKLYEESKIRRTKKHAKGIEFGDEMMNGMAAGSRGRDFILSIRRPKVMDSLPDLAEKWIP